MPLWQAHVTHPVALTGTQNSQTWAHINRLLPLEFSMAHIYTIFLKYNSDDIQPLSETRIKGASYFYLLFVIEC